MARPTIYTPKLGHKICKLITNGMSLRAVCRRRDMPSRSTIHEWLLDPERKAFSDQYARAMDIRAEYMVDEILDIADDGSNDYIERETNDGQTETVENTESIKRSRLRIDTRKWYVSKVLPKKYGNRIDLGEGGKALVMTFDNAFTPEAEGGSEA